MKSNQRVLFLIVLSLLFTVPALAQTHRASLRGTIYDPNKAVIPGATVKLTSLATGESRSTTSGENGEYAISSLAPGSYQIEIEKQAFKKYSQQIELLVNQVQRQDVALEVGGLSPSTVDTSFEANLKRDTPSLGTVIENRQVTGLPLDGRNFYELSLLVPGAVPAAPGSAGSARGDFAFSVNGAREDANNFLLDGV